MNKVKSNFLYNSAYQILILIVPFITTPYIARILKPEGVGIYSYTFAVVSYFTMVALLGNNTYGNREISKNRDDKEKLNQIFSSIYYLQLIITSIALIAYIVYCIFGTKYKEIAIIQGICVISTAFDINWLFCGLQQFKITVTRSAIIKIIACVCTFLFVKNQEDLWKYTLIMAMATLINQAILFPFLKKNNIKFQKVKLKEIFVHLKPTIILFIPTIATSIYNLMDKIMLEHGGAVTEVGYYENAEKMLNIILSVVAALGTVTLPEMTYLYAQKKYKKIEQIYNSSVEFIYFLIFPVIFGFMLTANELVAVYLGDNFSRSATLLKFLSFSLLFAPLSGITRMQLLIPKHKDKEYIYSVFAGAISNLLLNIILIPKLQAVGAAIATVVANLLVASMQIYYVHKDISFKECTKNILKFLLHSVAMFVIVYLSTKTIKNGNLKLVVQIVLGVLIYGILNLKYVGEKMKNLKK